MEQHGLNPLTLNHIFVNMFATSKNNKLSVDDSNVITITGNLGLYYFENLLTTLSREDVLHFYVHSMLDGPATIDIELSERTYQYYRDNIFPLLTDELLNLKNEVAVLVKEKADILSFDTNSMKIQISGAIIDVDKLKTDIQKNPLLEPLSSPVQIIDKYLSHINNVLSIYDSVYLHVIKPIKTESESGIKATRNWAIIGIILTTIISIVSSVYFSNKAGETTQKSTVPQQSAPQK